MHPLIRRHRAAIEELCRRYRVRRLEVFGSAARGADFDPSKSDVDFLVEYEPEHHPPSLKEFFDLQAGLDHVLARPVDLVMAGSIENPFVRADIESARELVYAA